jgi:hypothetical protein
LLRDHELVEASDDDLTLRQNALDATAVHNYDKCELRQLRRAPCLLQHIISSVAAACCCVALLANLHTLVRATNGSVRLQGN